MIKLKYQMEINFILHAVNYMSNLFIKNVHGAPHGLITT